MARPRKQKQEQYRQAAFVAMAKPDFIAWEKRGLEATQAGEGRLQRLIDFCRFDKAPAPTTTDWSTGGVLEGLSAWSFEELVAFCQQHGISHDGGDDDGDIIEAIIQHVEEAGASAPEL